MLKLCRGVVNDTYKMDLILVHPPHLIALACIYIASVSKEKDSIAWFEELRVDMNVVVFTAYPCLCWAIRDHNSGNPVYQDHKLVHAVCFSGPEWQMLLGGFQVNVSRISAKSF